MIGRFIWFAGLLIAAVLTTILQTDRQVERTPALAAMVPSPLRNYAQEKIVVASLQQADADRALAEARKLVRERPVPAEHLSLLAVAQVQAGQADAAGLTIQLASKRGWREPVAQESVLRLALAANDKPEAARRYAALMLRLETPDALLLELGPEIFDQPDGPGVQTLAAIVSDAERWHGTFLRRGSAVMPPAAFSAITSAVIGKGVPLDCKSLARAVQILAKRDQAASDSLAAVSTERCDKI